MRRDLLVQWRVFLGIAAFIGASAVVYWLASYEEAGTTMLALASGLAALVGGWLLVQDRKAVAQTDEAAEEDAPYLPTASAWPFVVGIGAALTLNGLILGWGYAVPGVIVLALALTGFVSEGRRRA
ncbi:MAG: aa3-type cytochrome oxidase subunit IV [Acidimicrobiales bacterium]